MNVTSLIFQTYWRILLMVCIVFPIVMFVCILQESVVAAQSCRVDVDVPGPDGRGWRKTGASFDTQELDNSVKDDLRSGARFLLEETWVPANDPHYDAKVFPSIPGKLRFVLVSPRDPFVHKQFIARARLFHDVWLLFRAYTCMCVFICVSFATRCMHPYGTGSLYAEPGSGKQTTHAFRRKLFAVQPSFRQSAAWIFWEYDRMLKHQLFKHHSFSRRGRAAAAEAGADNFVRAFGKDVPNVIPESTAWSKEQARDLDAITDVTELG